MRKLKNLFWAVSILLIAATLIFAITSCEDSGAIASSKVLTFQMPDNAFLTVRDIRVKGFTLDWAELPGKGYEYAIAATHDKTIDDYETALENSTIILDFTPSEALGGTYKVTGMIPGKTYEVQLFVRAKNTKAAEYLTTTTAQLPYLDDAELTNLLINGEEVLFNKSADTYSYYYLPGSKEEEQEYTITYNLMRQCELYIGGTKIESEEIKGTPGTPLELTVVHERTKAARDYTVYIGPIDNGLPVVIINTEENQQIYNTTEYLNADFSFIDSKENPSGGLLYNGGIEIKGRGHGSFNLPKKSYNFTLPLKSQMLDMASSQDWALMANYRDKSLVRSYTAYELARDMGAAFAPQVRFADLIMNGEYLGVYSISERVKIDKGRLDLPKIKAEEQGSMPDLTGSYILEVTAVNKYRQGDIIFETKQIKWGRGNYVSVEQPGTKNMSEEAYDYIKTYFNQAEDALFSDDFKDSENGYRAYIDTSTVIDWYIVTELYKSLDADFNSNVYFYKPRGEKLCMGPVWNFERSAGNTLVQSCDNPEGWYVREAVWIARMFEDEAFVQEFKERWNYVKENYLDNLFAHIDSTAKLLENSQLMDSAKWFGAESTAYADEINALKDWLTQRIDWIDTEVNK